MVMNKFALYVLDMRCHNMVSIKLELHDDDKLKCK